MSMPGITCVLAVVALTLLGTAYAAAEEVELIPRRILFGNPERISPAISPDGSQMAFVAPLDGVLNVWVRGTDEIEAKPLTHDKGRGITQYFWACNGRQIVYSQDRDGDENWHYYAIDVDTGNTLDLTPTDPAVDHAVQAILIASDPAQPDMLLVGLNRNDARSRDIYSVNVRTGALQFEHAGAPEIMVTLVDHNLKVRGALYGLPDGGSELRMYDAADQQRSVKQWGAEDALSSHPIAFMADNERLYLVDSAGRNSAALVEFDPRSGSSTVIAADPQYDVTDVFIHPTKYTLDAYAVARERVEWKGLNPEAQHVIDKLPALRDADFAPVSTTLDMRRMLFVATDDDAPTMYYTYDTATDEATELFVARPELVGKPLVQMQAISFGARDGLTIHGYLSLPKNYSRPGPLVLMVHGGPWHRASWGYNPETQWLANRGYACLQVNFRGSTGYGKQFLNAGNREWGGKMQDDLSDAVAWAVGQGIADPAKVVIYGASYGGYATLAGVTFTPELYAAGVSMVGPSDLETFLNTIPPYWESMRKQWDQRVGMVPRYEGGPRAGQPKDEADWTEAERDEIEFLRSRSPLFHVDNVHVPLLIGQGANDPRVNRAESDQFVKALQDKGLKVEYIVYDNEGHGFARPENILDFARHLEKFLSEVLGGRHEE